MSGKRRTPKSALQVQSIELAGAPSVVGSEGAEDDVSDAEAQVMVCRSATLSPSQYRFYCALLRAFVALSQAPDLEQVEDLARRYCVPLESTFERMEAQDLVQREPATGKGYGHRT